MSTAKWPKSWVHPEGQDFELFLCVATFHTWRVDMAFTVMGTLSDKQT
jgi:hypothetical protein